MPFRIAPDSLRDREPITKGRPPKNELSRALLEGSTVVITGTKNLGSLYTLAKRHNKRARTKKTILNDEEVIIVWFDEPAE